MEHLKKKLSEGMQKVMKADTFEFSSLTLYTKEEQETDYDEISFSSKCRKVYCRMRSNGEFYADYSVWVKIDNGEAYQAVIARYEQDKEKLIEDSLKKDLKDVSVFLIGEVL